MLKKTPDWPLLKALKAVVLVRTGKEDEASKLCEQLSSAVPTDEATLQAVSLAYKELGLNKAMVELYEKVSNLQPKNEEFAKNWFMAMVRNSDYKGQQQAALKLHRTFKSNKYLFWTVMSLVLQGQDGSALSYTLAERMMQKAHEEGRLEDVEHMRLYLLILLDQKKHAEALALLDTPLGQKSLKDPEVRQIRSELLLLNQKWNDVLSSSQHALRKENSDDWFSWLAYFDALEPSLETTPESCETAHQLVAELKESTLKSSVLKRGPFLAELELDHRLRKVGKQDNDDHTTQLIVSYFERFGSKSCCFEDLQTYTKFLRANSVKAAELIETLHKSIVEAKDKSGEIKNVYKRVNVYKIHRFLDLQTGLKLEEAISLVNELWTYYQNALPLGEGLEKTEWQYGDDFVILSAQILFDCYKEHKQMPLLIQAIMLLEIALTKSTYNFQIKLILVRLYHTLGIHARPLQIYQTMDIKQIQFDTMIHYFTDRYFSLACFDALEQTFFESLMIYHSNETETPEMLVKAYQFGTYSKIQEFIEFRSRLDKSLQHAVTKVELIRIGAINSSFQTKYAVQYFHDLNVSELVFDDEFVASRSDNRDFKVMMNCNSEDRSTAQECIKPAISTNERWVQIFNLIFHILATACSSKENSNLSSMVEKLAQLVELDDIARKITPQELWLARYISALASALTLMKGQDTRSADSDKITKLLNIATETLEQTTIQSQPFREDEVSWLAFHEVSITLEAFNYGNVLIELMNRSLGLTSKEAKRKATENSGSDPLIESLIKLQVASKKSLLSVKATVDEGKNMFKPQLQKKLLKQVVGSTSVLEHFKSKDNQNVLADNLKKMVASWNTSVGRLGDEIDSRVQKI
ncbi:N-alpha-acetyltransferase 25, NatB auxiliary subunit [Apophysomyces ossiformis]|uniref:N-alpha-acetyltransferase 25, NatB auxiliary subunit n=1 Tax=Apophysomyces ossiformis TaxID=679940 RepID=A0A8H7BWT6_9FUNG|nr:N-alpha-acetyltransferase 25, NatB auxiliary subunit [Apophysomyces ossiformis]